MDEFLKTDRIPKVHEDLFPLRDSKFSEELLALLSHITVKDELKQDTKKKNLNNRGIQ